jgi:hypothetical protein
MSYLPETKPRTSLIYIIHQADILASRIEFEREWMPKLYKDKVKVEKKKFVTKQEKVNNTLKDYKLSSTALDKLMAS